MSDYDIDHYHEDHCDPPPPRTKAGSDEHERWLDYTRMECEQALDELRAEEVGKKTAYDTYRHAALQKAEALRDELAALLSMVRQCDDEQSEVLFDCKVMDEWEGEYTDFSEDAEDLVDWQERIEAIESAHLSIQNVVYQLGDN